MKIELTQRQRELLTPTVSQIQKVRAQMVQLQQGIQALHLQHRRELELCYPALTPESQYIASEGVIEIPQESDAQVVERFLAETT